MDDKKKPTQKTPKGYEIPIPKEQEVEDALDKLAKPSKPLPPSSPKQ